MNSPSETAIATPERVALELPVAGIGYRSIAYLVDVLLIFAVWAVAYFVYSLVGPDLVDLYQGMATWTKAAAIVGFFASQWLYWTTFEIAWSGQTPGKRLLRIRVVQLDGSPVTLVVSATRNLLRFVDFLPAFYAVGLVAMLLGPLHRRLGDLVAGTMLVRDERVDLAKYRSELVVDAEPVVPAAGLRGAPLAVEELELLLGFLARSAQLQSEHRQRLLRRFLDRFAQNVPLAERERLASFHHAGEELLRQLALRPRDA